MFYDLNICCANNPTIQTIQLCTKYSITYEPFHLIFNNYTLSILNYSKLFYTIFYSHDEVNIVKYRS